MAMARQQESLVFVVQSLSCVWLFVTTRTAAHQVLLFSTISQRFLKLMSIESVMPSNHFILCHCLLLQLSTFPNMRVFSSESALHIRCPKYWGFSFSISPSSEYSEYAGLIGLISLLSKGLSRVFSSTKIQKHQFFGAWSSLWPNSHVHRWLLEKPSFDYMDLCQQTDVSAFEYTV